MKNLLLASIITIAISSLNITFAADPQDHGHAEEAKMVTLGGYDAVAYFLEEEAQKGRTEYSHEWNGMTWLFANAKNLEAFAAHPELYQPQFDGNCVVSVANGKASLANPACFAIQNGKLFLLSSPELVTLLETDFNGFVNKAEENWPQIKDMMDSMEKEKKSASMKSHS